MRTAIAVLCIKANRVLLVNKKGVWILLGGKPENEEADSECLMRESTEELPNATLHIGDFFGEFIGLTPFSKTELTTRVYFGGVEGDLTPGAEIQDAQFFERSELATLSISDITTQILDRAIETGHLS